jgi:hypothetical protein
MTALFVRWALPRAAFGLTGFYAFALLLWSITP